MFDIGFWEIALILVLALIVLGPERLPQAARTFGHWVGKARRYIEGVKSEVEREFDTGELKRMLHNQEVQLKELQSKLNDSEDYVNKDYHNMFADKDDPGTDAESNYDIIEEDDEEYAGLEESPKKPATDNAQKDKVDQDKANKDKANKDQSADAKQPKSESSETDKSA